MEVKLEELHHSIDIKEENSILEFEQDNNESNERVSKRKRSKNFMEDEVRMLVNIAIQNKHIIENKKTDAVTWKEKENCWRKISSDFAAISGTERSATVLRSKYESLKYKLKAKVARNKCEVFKTGGGTPKIEPFSNYEKDLLEIVQGTVNGIPCEFDSNSSKSYIVNTQSQAAIIEEMSFQPANSKIINLQPSTSGTTSFEEIHLSEESKEVEVHPISQDKNNWSTWNPKALKQKRHSRLKPITKNTLNNKCDSMIKSREELLRLQIDALHEDMLRKRRLTEAEEEFLKEERKLKLQLLQLQIENQKLLLDKKK